MKNENIFQGVITQSNHSYQTSKHKQKREKKQPVNMLKSSI